MTRVPWFLVAPTLVLAQQAIAYALVPWSCGHQTVVPLHAVMVITAAAVGTGLVIGWKEWREVRVDKEADAHGGAMRARRDFVALLDALASLIALLVLVAQWIGILIVSPCH